MIGPYLFPALQGQTIVALRVCDPARDSRSEAASEQPLPQTQTQSGIAEHSSRFGAIALQCERHTLLCYCPVRYLLYPHGSTFGRYRASPAILPFRASLCESDELHQWLPITADAHWSHHADPWLPMRGDVLATPPQLRRAGLDGDQKDDLKDDRNTDWWLALRLVTGREFQLSWDATGHRVRLASTGLASTERRSSFRSSS